MAIVHQPFQETPSSIVSNYSAATTYTPGTYYHDTAANRYWSLNSGNSSGVGSFETDQYIIDAESDTDVLPLPAGVGAQLLNNATIAGGVRTTNGYVSFGAILFNGSGNLSSGTISIAQNGIIGSASAITSNLPNPSTNAAASNITSQFGVVLFDLQSYMTIGGSMQPQVVLNPTLYSPAHTYAANEKSQEDWLDKNSTPLLINRYNGTLIKSE